MKKANNQTATQPTSKNYLLLAILLITAIAYFPVFGNGFVWDDEVYILGNRLIQSFDLKEIFTTPVLGNYHPITILIFAIEYKLFGFDETGYHAVNLLLHLMNTLLVYFAIFRLSGNKIIALVAALLFGIHPLHVESVAWAAELKDLLYTLFFLAAYISYLKYTDESQKKHYYYALLFFVVALLSKAMASSLPVMLILTDYFKGRKINTKTLLEKTPYFLLSLVFGIGAIMAQKTSHAMESVDQFTVFQHAVFACYAFLSYLIKLILPIQLSAFYPYPVKSGEDIPLQFYGYVMLFLIFIAGVIYSLKYSKKLFFGIGFFAITVFLVLQLIPVGNALMADRYSYLPSVGIFYLAGEGFLFLRNGKWRSYGIALLAFFSVLFFKLTYDRCKVWKNGITLWTDVIHKNPSVYAAHLNRGILLMNANKSDDAMNDFNAAVTLNPVYANGYYNRAILKMKLNRNEEAMLDLNKAIELNAAYSEAYSNRAMLYMRSGRPGEGLNDLNKAIELNPRNVDAYNNRGLFYINEKKYDEALRDLDHSLALNPNNINAYSNKGSIYYMQNKFEEAINSFSKAIALKPDYAELYFNRGLAYYNTGRKDAACTDLQQAARLGNPNAAGAMQEICR
jgi:tetratricopeptide (TPR) repeat protein